MTKRAVKQFPLECMGMVEWDVTGSALLWGDANGSVITPECASRVSMRSNHHLTA